MLLQRYIVLDQAGKKLRGGLCSAADMASQARPGETVRVSTDEELAAHRDAVRDSLAQLVASYASSQTTSELVVEALSAKGIISAADLKAAATRLKAKSAGP